MDKKLIILVVVLVAAVAALPFVAKVLRQGQPGSPEPAAAATPVSPAPSGSAPVPDSRQDEPVIVAMTPENGASDINPDLTELVVTFDRAMGGGFSWTGGGEHFPETTDKPSWSADKKTCRLPVRLKAGWSYRLGINSPSHRNFKSEQGVSVKPVVWTFATALQ